MLASRAPLFVGSAEWYRLCLDGAAGVATGADRELGWTDDQQIQHEHLSPALNFAARESFDQIKNHFGQTMRHLVYIGRSIWTAMIVTTERPLKDRVSRKRHD